MEFLLFVWGTIRTVLTPLWWLLGLVPLGQPLAIILTVALVLWFIPGPTRSLILGILSMIWRWISPVLAWALTPLVRLLARLVGEQLVTRSGGQIGVERVEVPVPMPLRARARLVFIGAIMGSLATVAYYEWATIGPYIVPLMEKGFKNVQMIF
jgi:hypothetical protein